MSLVDTAIYAYMWGHFVINFTALIIVGFALKGNFPFFDNYLTIMGFLLNNYDIRSTMTNINLSIDRQTNQSHIVTIEEKKEEPITALVSEQNLSVITNGQPVESKHEESESKIVDSVNAPIPNDPPPPHIVEAVKRCQQRIRELKQHNPNGNYRVMPTARGLRIIEMEVINAPAPSSISNPETNLHIDGLRRRNSGEV